MFAFMPSFQAFAAAPTAETASSVEKKDETPVPIRRAPFYKLIDSRRKETKDSPIRVGFRGCEGSGDTDQKETAKLMDKHVTESNADFTVSAGDMLYDDGAESARDPAFDALIHGMYKSRKVCFASLGNHDLNFHGTGNNFGGNVKQETIDYYLRHTILDKDGNEDPKKIAILKQDVLDLAEMEAAGMDFVMPDRFYGYEYRGIEFLHADSNLFAKEFLALHEEKDSEFVRKKDVDTSINGAAWLEERLNMNPDKPKVVIWHHPLEAVNKLAYLADTHLYLDKQINPETKLSDYQKFNKIFKDEKAADEGHGKILRRALEKMGLLSKIKAFYVAHNHAMYQLKFHDLFQIVVGGGGGENQPQYNFNLPEAVEFYSAKLAATDANKHGFVLAEFDPGNGYSITNTFYHCDESIVKMSEKNISLRAGEEDPEVTKLRNIVLSACDKCFNNNPYIPSWISAQAGRLPASWGYARDVLESFTLRPDLRRIQDLKQIFHSFKVEPLQYYLAALKSTLASIAMLPGNTTLEVFLNEHFKKAYDMTYAEYRAKHTPEKKADSPKQSAESTTPVLQIDSSPKTPASTAASVLKVLSPKVSPSALKRLTPKTSGTSAAQEPPIELKDFRQKTPSPKKALFSADEAIIAKGRLRLAVCTACAEYENFIRVKKSGHGKRGKERVANIRQFFADKTYEQFVFENILETLKSNLTYKLLKPGKNSLFDFINQNLELQFEISYQNLIDNPRRILDKIRPPKSAPIAIKSSRTVGSSASAGGLYATSPPLSCSIEARTAVGSPYENVTLPSARS